LKGREKRKEKEKRLGEKGFGERGRQIGVGGNAKSSEGEYGSVGKGRGEMRKEKV